MFKRMISTVHLPNIILRGRCLSWMISTVHHPNTILRGRCLRAPSKHYPKRTMFKLDDNDIHCAPSKHYPKRTMFKLDDIHCASSKHYPKRTMFKGMISTVHHPNTLLRRRCLRGLYPLCTIQTLS